MPTIKGKIEGSGTSEFEKDGKKMTRWFIKMPGTDKQISGFGAMPDMIKNAINSKEEIDIEYNIKGDYWNYGPQPEKKGGWSGIKKTDPEQYAQMMRMSVIKFLGMLQEGLDTPFDKKNEQCKKVFDFWYAVVAKGDNKVGLPETEPTKAKPETKKEEEKPENTETTGNENEDAEAFM